MISPVSGAYAGCSGVAYTRSAATATTASTTGSQSSGVTGDGSSTDGVSVGGMSIAGIRDITDQMAMDGKLTIKQQMALIGGGLMDPNPEDPSYQPAASGIQVGYSRSDTGSYDFMSMMQGYATEAASLGNSELAGIYSGIAQSYQDYVASQDCGALSHVDISA